MSKKTEILVATHNGQRFLREQLDSVLAQTCTDFTIRIRDDDSTDSTVQIIEQYVERHPDRFIYDGSNETNVGACANFSRLLEASDADYLFFCDQDDVWLPDKVDAQRQQLMALEEEHGIDTPLLVHSDLEVVDENLNTLDRSFWHYQYLCPAKMQTLNRLLVQNCVTGCATAINKTLAKLGTPIPTDAIMHDWWLALIAVALGHIHHDPTPLTRYRQHSSNDTGAKKWGLRYVFGRALGLLRDAKLKESLRNSQNQAIELVTRYRERLSTEEREAVKAHSQLLEQTWVRRRREIVRHGLLKHGFARNIALLLRC